MSSTVKIPPRRPEIPLILTWDIETLPVKYLAFSCGKQYLNHKQLFPRNQFTRIICITYCWNDGKPPKIIWFDDYNWKAKVKEFDLIINAADYIIGKNSDRFDNKHINTHRLMADLPGMSDWLSKTDDLEKQFRKHFNLQSQSLDYISNLLNLGGKDSMEWNDWVHIFQYRELKSIQRVAGKEASIKISPVLYNISYTEVMKLGKRATRKMGTYGKKDTADTRAIWNKTYMHFSPKFNMGAFRGEQGACFFCGSDNVVKNGDRKPKRGLPYQRFLCKDCPGSAGRRTIKADGSLGPMRR